MDRVPLDSRLLEKLQAALVHHEGEKFIAWIVTPHPDEDGNVEVQRYIGAQKHLIKADKQLFEPTPEDWEKANKSKSTEGR